MKKLTFIFLSLILAGCAPVQIESQQTADQIKKFSAPAKGNAGLYIFRDGVLGLTRKRTILIDNNCLGKSVYGTFFYTQVEGNKEHEIETESEFSPNKIKILVETDRNYFVRQFIRPGLLSITRGADFELVPEEQAKPIIEKLELASTGDCS